MAEKAAPEKPAGPKVIVNPTGPQTTEMPVDYMQQLRDMTIATAEAEKPSGNWISFKGGILTINGQAMKGNKAKTVILQSIFENQLYAGRYDPNNQQPPICYAFAEKEEDLAPHPDSLKPQHATCKGCPHNEWGSDPGGGKGKACKNVRRLALIADADLEDVPKAEVFLAKLPVTSVKNWSAYASQLANVLKQPPICFITEVYVEPDAKTQFQVGFNLVDKVDPEHFPALLNKRRDSQSLVFAPYAQPTDVAEEAPRKF